MSVLFLFALQMQCLVRNEWFLTLENIQSKYWANGKSRMIVVSVNQYTSDKYGAQNVL